jgi:septum formation protein
VKLILGSASPRRRDLLAQIGVVPDEIRPADIDETPLKGELPRVYVERIAREKCAALNADGLVLTADTTVHAGRRILGKPADAAEATQFLLLLSGRAHRVTTSVVARLGQVTRQKTVETRVKMKRLSDAEISAYLRSGEWQGKAGGYAIQGLAAAPDEAIAPRQSSQSVVPCASPNKIVVFAASEPVISCRASNS